MDKEQEREQAFKKMNELLEELAKVDNEVATYLEARGVDPESADKIVTEDMAEALLYLEGEKHPIIRQSAVMLGAEFISYLVHVVHVGMMAGAIIGIKNGMERQEFNALNLPDINLD